MFQDWMNKWLLLKYAKTKWMKCLNEWINEMEEEVSINELTKWKQMSQWMNELINRKQIS
jgi:hypothetical protein